MGRGGGGGGGGSGSAGGPPPPVNYSLLTLDELVALCKKRGIRLNSDEYNKWKIIARLKDWDREAHHGMCMPLFMRIVSCCIPKRC